MLWSCSIGLFLRVTGNAELPIPKGTVWCDREKSALRTSRDTTNTVPVPLSTPLRRRHCGEEMQQGHFATRRCGCARIHLACATPPRCLIQTDRCLLRRVLHWKELRLTADGNQ
ncbi:hypothetical protein F5Y18DRAFT_397270 [Xylariaceae sp. FL1019]|nr:hypothetical protein F5Y18DRAFT_397270 [Xylariaceae sp. FL1019]